MLKTRIVCDCANCEERATRFSIPAGRVAEQGTGSMTNITFDVDLCPMHQKRLLELYMEKDRCALLGEVFGMELRAT